MTRALAALTFTAALIATIGAGLFDPWLMAVGGVGAALAALIWGYYARDDGVRWRFDGARYYEPGYTGEVFLDGAWVDEPVELDERAVWPAELGGVE